MDRSIDETGLGRTHREQIERVVDELHDALGADLLGSYLYGSAVEGGLRPRSDLDMLAISRVRATERQRQRLVSRLLAISSDWTDPGSSRPIDLAVVVGSEIRPWRYPPTVDLQYGEWLRSRFEASEREVSLPRDDPDVVLSLSMVRDGGVTLWGPPPASLIDPVPRLDAVKAMVAGLDELLADIRWDTTNVVLTLVRIWSSVVVEGTRSKDAAADWALGRLEPAYHLVLERARDAYVTNADPRWDGLRGAVDVFATRIVAEIRASAR